MIFKNYILNLNWNIASSKSNFYKEHDKKVGLYLDGMSLGVFSDDLNFNKKTSLASLASNINDNFVYITDKFSDDSKFKPVKYWICIIKDGKILPKFYNLKTPSVSSYLATNFSETSSEDAISSGDNLVSHEVLNELLIPIVAHVNVEKAKNKNLLTICDVSDNSFSKILKGSGFKNNSHEEFLSLIENLSKSEVKSSTLNKIRKNRMIEMIAYISVFSVILFFAFQWYSDYSDKVLQERLQNERILKHEQYLKKEQVKKYKESLSLFKNNNMADFLDSTNVLLASIPKIIYGWELSEITYDVSSEDNLFAVTYKRNDYSSVDVLPIINRDLKSKNVNISKDANKATFLISKKTNHLYSGNTTLELLNNNKMKALKKTQFISNLQTSIIKYLIIGSNTTDLGLSNKFKLTGKSLYELNSFLYYSINTPTFLISNMKIIFNNSNIEKWDITGVLYD